MERSGDDRAERGSAWRRRARACAAALAAAALIVALARCGEEPAPAERGGGRSAERSPPAGAGPLRNDLAAPRGRAKIALLVGIGAYPAASGFGQLRGPANDVRLVHHTLVTRFGFDPADIKELVDEEATHENIVRWFDRWLIQGATEETQVVFWFSGHGSVVPDRAAKGRGELDGLDSTLVAYDSRAAGQKGEYDIVDDALEALVHRCPSRWITVVTDACHSGSVLRGGGDPGLRTGTPGVRAPVAVPAFWPAGLEVRDDDDPGRGRAGQGYVHIAAALDHQSAVEIRPPALLDELPGADRFGALTWHLCAALRYARNGETYRELVAEVQQRTSLTSAQTVAIEGEQDRVLFGDAFVGAPAGLPVFLLEDGKLRVNAGSLLGVGEGTVLDVVPSSGGASIGRAVVYKATAARAFARFDGEVSPAPGKPLLARVVSRPRHLPRLRTLVRDDRLAAELTKNVWLERVGDPQRDHDYVLEVRDAHVEWRTREGHRLLRRAVEGGVLPLAAVEDCARFEAWFQWLWRLAAPGRAGGLQLRGRFRAPEGRELIGWTPKMHDAGVRPLPGAADGTFGCAITDTYAVQKERDLGWLTTLVVELDQPASVAVISLSEARSIDDMNANVVWPSSETPYDTRVAGSVDVHVWLEASAAWDLERPVRERYLLLALTEAVDFRALLTDVKTRLRGGGEQRLPESLFGDPATWGVRAVDLLIAQR